MCAQTDTPIFLITYLPSYPYPMKHEFTLTSPTLTWYHRVQCRPPPGLLVISFFLFFFSFWFLLLFSFLTVRNLAQVYLTFANNNDSTLRASKGDMLPGIIALCAHPSAEMTPGTGVSHPRG